MSDYNNQYQGQPTGYKFCSTCGTQIDVNAAVCPNCGSNTQPVGNGGQYQQPVYQQPIYQPAPTIINNVYYGKPKDKWVAFLLCFFLGTIGIHKFYEGKIGMGILYLFTFGLFGIGWFVDWIIILCKPNPYYVWLFLNRKIIEERKLFITFLVNNHGNKLCSRKV